MVQQVAIHQTAWACLPLECDINENVCGGLCYNPQLKVTPIDILFLFPFQNVCKMYNFATL